MAVDRAWTKLVGCRLPLQLASLGGPIGTPTLAAAVSQAGGLGMIANPSSAAEVHERMQSARGLTDNPIGIGFLVPFVEHDAVRAAAATADVVDFFYGDPDAELVRVAGGEGALVGWQTGSVAEAAAAVEAGCGYVAVQGVEAGGHIRGRQPLDEVLAEVLEAVEVPVVAAGGIGTAERVREVLSAGAAAVRIGTRLVAAEESGAHPAYVQKLIAASRQDTIVTEAFATGWPDAPHRVLRSAIEAAERIDRPIVGRLGELEIPPFAPRPPTRLVDGEITAMALYAGESVDAVTRIAPAAAIVAELTREV